MHKILKQNMLTTEYSYNKPLRGANEGAALATLCVETHFVFNIATVKDEFTLFNGLSDLAYEYT